MKPSSTDGVQPARFDRQLDEFGGSWIDAAAQHRIGRVAERARQQALSAGYAAGWAQGRQAAAAAAETERAEQQAVAERQLRELARRVDAVVAGLTRAAAALDATLAPRWVGN